MFLIGGSIEGNAKNHDKPLNLKKYFNNEMAKVKCNVLFTRCYKYKWQYFKHFKIFFYIIGVN